MREILFRGKPKNKADLILVSQMKPENVLDDFVLGLLIIKDDRYFICVSTMGISNGSLINNCISSVVEVIPETVGEFTGLTDKNGKKIFEGDIVKDVTVPVQCGIGIVKFGKYETRINFSLRDDNYSYHIGVYIKWNKTLNFYRHDLAFWNERIEVIGNIHDNQELLNT